MLADTPQRKGRAGEVITEFAARRRDPTSWPIGNGHDFLGTWDFFPDAPLLFERGVHDRVVETVRCSYSVEGVGR